MIKCLGCWILTSNIEYGFEIGSSGVWGSKPTGGSMVNSAFRLSEVD